MNDESTSEPKSTKMPQLSHAGLAIVLGLIWERMLWGYWGQEINALGLNAAVFLLLFVFFILREDEKPSFSFRYSKLWCLPLLLIALSYSLYENPFIKACNILAIPAIFGFVVQRESTTEPMRMFKNGFHTAMLILYAMLGPLGYIGTAFKSIFQSIASFTGRVRLPASSKSRSIFKGVALFSLLAVFVVIPLLGSVDPKFAATFQELYAYAVRVLKQLFEVELILRLVAILFVAVAVLCMRLAWRVGPANVQQDDSRQYDSIVAGILLGGITLLYLVFLYIQLERLFVTALPQTFSETERYVKQGFWQLIFLSGMNLFFVFTYFRRTVQTVQCILVSFTVVSLALLFSAAHRMFLYVTLHGLSYEKFYASYAVLYCFALFAMLLFVLLKRSHRPILRDACALLIWMYACACLIPVEQIIIRFNTTLAASSNSRIELSDMHMLSVDALSYVRTNRSFLQSLPPRPSGRWHRIDSWIKVREEELARKRWYENTLTSAIARLQSGT